MLKRPKFRSSGNQKFSKNYPKIVFYKFFQEVKTRLQTKISRRFLDSGQKVYILKGKKDFYQNARKFGPPATFKSKNFQFQQKFQKLVFWKLFRWSKFGRKQKFLVDFCSPVKKYIFLLVKKIHQNAHNFGPTQTFKVKNFQKQCPKIAFYNFFQEVKIRPETKISVWILVLDQTILSAKERFSKTLEISVLRQGSKSKHSAFFAQKMSILPIFGKL